MDAHASSDDRQGASLPSSSAQVVTPTKLKPRGLLADLAGWPSYSDMHSRAPGDENIDLRQPSNPTSETPAGTAQFQKSSHLPTPQSPRYAPSYLLTGTPPAAQNPQPDPESRILPTKFRPHASSSPASFRAHSIPTPEPSPLVARSRSNGSHSLPYTNLHNEDRPATPSKRDTLRSRTSTPPRTPSRQMSTRPVTPVFHSRPPTPLEGRPIPHGPARFDNTRANNSAPSSPLQRVKDEPGGEVARIRAQLIENHHLASTQAAELRRPDYLKRTKRLAPSSSIVTSEASVASDMGGKEASLLWSSATVGVVDSPGKGKRIALFQETSEESFEESLMAGGYGRYRSDKPPWKLDENAETPNQQHGDAVGEAELGSGLILPEEEKRKKMRLAAFLDPPRGSSTPQLLPVELEGCGRVLVKLESSEPQTPPKSTPKARRSRKRKKVSADMKHDVERESVAAPEVRAVDEPNWPDTEFPWRSRQMTRDGHSIAEREERLRYIESFLDRNSDEEDDVEDLSSSSRHSPDEARSRSPRLGRGKSYPLLSHYRDRRRGLTALSVIPSDPADAKTALLSKKSIRAVQLRLLRRRNTRQTGDGEDGETLCVCQGRDDGRPLVQCDACRMWYHLECIGIQSTSELGREEDLWFCSNCVDVRTPSPVVMSEPTFVPSDDGEHGNLGEYDPPFFDSGLHPSPATPWTRSTRPPTTPPPHIAPGAPWEEPPSSSSCVDPRTPQFNTASAFGDMVRVYSTTPGRSLEPLPSAVLEEAAFDPTSTPSRGIKFGLPFTTPKDGRWGSSTWQGVRGSGCELFLTPNRPGEDGGVGGSSRSDQPLLAHGKVGELPEDDSGVQGLYRMAGPMNVTPIERNGFGGPKRMHVLESPLGAKRPRRVVDP